MLRTRASSPSVVDPLCKLWPVQRTRCSRVILRAQVNIAPEMVQLERSCLADLSTEELEQQLKKHGGCGYTGAVLISCMLCLVNTN